MFHPSAKCDFGNLLARRSDGIGLRVPEVLGLRRTGVAGRLRFKSIFFDLMGPQGTLQYLLIGGETLPLLMRFSLAFWTFKYALYFRLSLAARRLGVHGRRGGLRGRDINSFTGI